MDTLVIEKKDGYCIVQMNNGKVNAFDTALSRELKEVFTELASDDKNRGVILAGRPHCFSAGLDVVKLLEGGVDGARVFWTEYLSMLKVLVRYPKPFVAAITGYAPAGGTIPALCADYRIMGKGDKHVIGMHEFKMSMQVPELMCDIYAYQLGETRAWTAIQKAELFNSDQAVEVGLVNESLEVEEVLPRAEKYLQKMMNVYGPCYNKSKGYFRKALLKLVDRELDPMLDVIIKDLEDPIVQQSLQFFLAGLKK